MAQEFTDSAFNMWATSGARTVEEFVRGEPAGVLEALKKQQEAWKAAEDAKAKVGWLGRSFSWQKRAGRG